MKAAFAMGMLAATVGATGHALAQQPDPLTDFEIRGKVYEPQPVSPTDERVAQLRRPQGFTVHRFAEGLDNPRVIAVANDGTVYVTQRRPGNLVMLRDTDRDGVADVQRVVLRLPDVHGVEVRDRRIYLVTVKKVYSADLRSDGGVANLRVISSNLPDAGQHPNRTLRFGPDGELYLSIGSTCNACAEPNPENATLVKVSLADGKREIFASGLRNTIGFDWHPLTLALYGVDNGIDWLGDDEQSEELNLIEQGKRYGWPYIYDDGELNPQDEPEFVTQYEWARTSENPVDGYTAHAAPMQMRFYTAQQFPMEYRNSAFVAMHGSWNRKPSSGYEVVRVRFDSAGAFDGFEPFLTGFLVAQPQRKPPLPGAQVLPARGFIGRPVGVGVAADGALLVGDDANNVLYRVAYGRAPKLTPQKLAIELVQPATQSRIQVKSSAFGPRAPIPPRYSNYGQDLSPPLSWSGVPAGTKSLVLMMEDPDATSPLPFVHWTMINLPPRTEALPENVEKVERPSQAPAARQGSQSKSTLGYFGPRPPAGDAPHAYHFQVFALDSVLSLPTGFNRHALISAMSGHVLAEGELIGTFAKAP